MDGLYPPTLNVGGMDGLYPPTLNVGGMDGLYPPTLNVGGMDGLYPPTLNVGGMDGLYPPTLNVGGMDCVCQVLMVLLLTSLEMGREAAASALKDAKIAYTDVEAVVASYNYGDPTCGKNMWPSYRCPSVLNAHTLNI